MLGSRRSRFFGRDYSCSAYAEVDDGTVLPCRACAPECGIRGLFHHYDCSELSTDVCANFDCEGDCHRVDTPAPVNPETTWWPLGEPVKGSVAFPFSFDADHALAFSGDGSRLAVGFRSTPLIDPLTVTASIRCYGWNGSNWIPLGSPHTSLWTMRGGQVLSLSYNGTVLAMGSPGDGRNESVQVLRWDGEDYVPFGNPIFG